MSLVDEYKRQFKWRSWAYVMDILPVLRDNVVLDLGCGVGDISAEFVARGARVVGVDKSEELLEEARSRELAGADFRKADIRSLPDLGLEFDGIWCSFVVAYLPDLGPLLRDWRRFIRTGGWIVLTEVDDLFAHEPLPAAIKSMLDAYVRESLAAGRYDFRMGRKIPGYLEKAGFTISQVLQLEDQELSFPGPADPEVVDAWRSRFDRMGPLRDFCGTRFDELREAFFRALQHPDHRSDTEVYCCVATH